MELAHQILDEVLKADKKEEHFRVLSDSELSMIGETGPWGEFYEALCNG
jgi:hypothetical protein